MFRQQIKADDLRGASRTGNNISRKDYLQTLRKEEMKKTVFQRKKQNLDSIKRDILIKKRRLEQIHYSIRRLIAETTRFERKFEQEKQEDVAVETNLKKEQKELTEKNTGIDSEISKLDKEVEELKKIIKEKELELQNLEKNEDKLKQEKQRRNKNTQSVISRLIQVLKREKRETDIVGQKFELSKKKTEVLKQENSKIHAEIDILENRVRNLEREIQKN